MVESYISEKNQVNDKEIFKEYIKKSDKKKQPEANEGAATVENPTANLDSEGMSIERQVAKINLKKDLSDDKYNDKNLNDNSDSDITKKNSF